MTRSRILVFGARCLSGCPKPGRAAPTFLAVRRAHGVMQGSEAAPQEAQQTLLLCTIVRNHVERGNYRNRRAVVPKTLNFSSAGVDHALNNSDDPWVDPDERAQVMILEQLCAELESSRRCFLPLNYGQSRALCHVECASIHEAFF